MVRLASRTPRRRPLLTAEELAAVREAVRLIWAASDWHRPAIVASAGADREAWVRLVPDGDGDPLAARAGRLGLPATPPRRAAALLRLAVESIHRRHPEALAADVVATGGTLAVSVVGGAGRSRRLVIEGGLKNRNT